VDIYNMPLLAAWAFCPCFVGFLPVTGGLIIEMLLDGLPVPLIPALFGAI
jgi:hypothetical protein